MDIGGTGRRSVVAAVLCGILVAVLLIAASPATVDAAAPRAAPGGDRIQIAALSNRADLVSGGDVLLELRLPEGLDPAQVRVDVDGRDVTSAFAVRDDGRFIGLVDGLRVGSNTVTAVPRRGRGASGARLEVTNHPIGGPVFSGPQIQPWYCLPGALDEQCNRPTVFEYFYRSTDGGGFRPYDPDDPPDDVAMTTTDQGETVPYVVRVETGNMDRNQYRIAVLAQPQDQWTRWTGPPAWNHKVWVPHGAGCSMSHEEGSAPDVLRDMVLSQGFAAMSTALADNTYSCNLVVQAESVMMAKEHLVEHYGDVRYLFGVGCSGGSIASLSMANAYPGLYDGLVVGCTFPDVPVNDLLDCTALLRYWGNPTRWAPGVVWTEPQQAAAAGLASTSVCRAWVDVYHYPEMFNPRTGVGCDVPQKEPQKVYHPETNPGGVRCSFQDHLVNIFGLRPPDRWGPVEQQIDRGFANRPYDNVGVQYGLRTLFAGDITPAQFVDLNAKVGGVDIDFGRQPDRVQADPGAVDAAYRSGVLNQANHLDRVPIIDLPGTFSGDRYEIHDNYKSWALRTRLDAATGGHGNHVMWFGPDRTAPLRSGNNIMGDGQAFEAMDAWLAAIEDDGRDVPLSRKVADNRPEVARDRCDLPDQQTCAALFGPAGNTRWAAGQPTLANDVVKCDLEPLLRSDYVPILFTDSQWDQLKQTFPTGVCDWTQPGVGQQGTVAWQTYADGPGGLPLGPPPPSTSLKGS